jgi:putative DNA primase/helicase
VTGAAEPKIDFAALNLSGLTSQLDFALAYAAAGMAVFPVNANKEPLTTHGYLDATTDTGVIRGWWGRYKAADIAWALPLEIMALDLDEKHGDHGLRDFLDIEGVAADTVATPQTTSPTGGRHLIYATEGRRYKNRVKAIPGKGIDIRCRGGYVVLPGHGNGRHWAVLTTTLLPTPNWVPVAQEVAASTSTAQPYIGNNPLEAAIVAWACDAIRNAPRGEQECTLNKQCYTMGGLIEGGSVAEGPAEEALIQAAWVMPTYDVRRPWDREALRNKVRGSIADGKRYPLDPPYLGQAEWQEEAAKLEADEFFKMIAADALGSTVEKPEPNQESESESGPEPESEDAEAEVELAKYVGKLREAKGKSTRNALAYNAGVRLGRFIKAGRLSKDRVVAEINAAIDWAEP